MPDESGRVEEAGVAFGSFYNYFPSKEELARALFFLGADIAERAP